MEQVEIYIGLFAIIAVVGILSRNLPIPTSLMLVITGMVISLIPGFPHIHLNPKLALDIFLPLLLYDASAYTSSWQEIKTDLKPIVLLSIGHVIFITILVAVTIHFLIPEFGWPLAFVLGAVISPPDDVAILSIAEKIKMPTRLVNILKGEAMLNDATALIIFRFALLAVVTHEFHPLAAISSFFMIVICESLYGLTIGYLIGELRLKLNDAKLQMLVSVLTPFITYLPAEKLGGSGVISTVVAGLFIGYRYWDKYPPQVRLTARSVWNTLGFSVQSLLFLLVGLDFEFNLVRNSTTPPLHLLIYSLATITVVVVGRFVWVYSAAYLPRFFSSQRRKTDPILSWQYLFVISWCGMRGGISLAAAIAVPPLALVANIYPRELLIFLVFFVIVATLLLQGLSLPWILHFLGIQASGKDEDFIMHHKELQARAMMAKAVLRWLADYAIQAKDNEKLLAEIHFHQKEYRMMKSQLADRLKNQNDSTKPDDSAEIRDEMFLLSQLIEVERKELLLLWQADKLDFAAKIKLEQQLDLRAKHLEDLS